MLPAWSSVLIRWALTVKVVMDVGVPDESLQLQRRNALASINGFVAGVLITEIQR